MPSRKTGLLFAAWLLVASSLWTQAFEKTPPSLLGGDVSPQDFTLDPPAPSGSSIYAPIFGYAHQWKPGKPIPGNPAFVQRPMYEPFDRDDDAWWDEQLDELLFSRSSVVMLHTRGCYKPDDPLDDRGPGNMCPHLLRKMVAAVDRADARSLIRFGAFYDTAAILDARSHALGHKADFDLSPQPDAGGNAPLYYFWEAGIKPWFDTVPRDLWYVYDDHGVKKPVVAFWGLGPRFINKGGHLRPLLEEVRKQFEARYHVAPFFFLTNDWISADPSLAGDGDLVGAVESWFAPFYGDVTGVESVESWANNKWAWKGKRNGLSTLTQWNGLLWGAATPSYSCGPTCGIPSVGREDGRNFVNALTLMRPAKLTLVEAFNGPLEGNGLFRSDDPAWDYSNQYLDILREFNDPELPSLKLQAEGADVFDQKSAKPPGVFRFGKSLGIIPQKAGDSLVGWSLGATEAGESFTYLKIMTPAAPYKFTLRAANPSGVHRAHLEIDGRPLPSVEIPPTSTRDRFIVVDLGTSRLTQARHDFKVVMDDGGLDVDWLFMKKQPH